MVSITNSVPSSKNGKIPVVIFWKKEPLCLIMADEFLLLHEIKQAYAEHSGYEWGDLSLWYAGTRMLECE